MFPFVFEQLADSPHWLEKLSWGSQIILVIAGIVTLVLGYIQVRANTKISQGTLLLELDARWDSPDMKEARKLIADLMQQTQMIVAERNPLVADGAKMCLAEAELAKQLATLRTESEETYLKILGFAGFFETVGLMVRKNYVSATDVIDLFKGPILDVGTVFRAHMAEREKEIGVPSGLLEHAFYLVTVAQRAN